MKNSLFSKFRTTLKNIPAMRILVIASFLLFSSQLDLLHAQGPRLSIQGILKKTSGEAVTDGNYKLTFRLYTTPTGPITANVWEEIQTDVEVVSGIYSTVLGNVTPLSISFNQVYYLGVTVGSTEMTPRTQMTSAPYALSLIGNTNQFPSSGIVLADSVRVSGGVLAKGGAPGANGANKNGFAFTGNNGDKDSGLFSTANGQVSLYSDNQKTLTVTPDSVAIRKDLRLNNDGNINYNGLDDWRLVETDYFENGNNSESWKVYNPTPSNGIINAWSNGTGSPADVTTFSDDFAGKALMPSTVGQVFKKLFTLPGGSTAGTYTYVKVVFNYYFLNTWGTEEVSNRTDVGWAGFSKVENCSDLSLGWFSGATAFASHGHGMFEGTGQFGGVASFVGTNYSDQWRTEEMVARYPSGMANPNFYVIFGFATDGPDLADENFAVGHIEVWVK